MEKKGLSKITFPEDICDTVYATENYQVDYLIIKYNGFDNEPRGGAKITKELHKSAALSLLLLWLEVNPERC